MDTTSEKKKFKLLDPEVHTPAFYGSWFLLLAFWILITWTLNYQSLLVGLVASYGLTRFNRSLIITPSERFLIKKETILMSLRYLGLMLVAIVKANIDVAVIVLQRRMPISPGIVKFKTDIRKDFDRVLLANSITLTPGTLTIDMEDDVYVVHCLTRANAEDVCQWNMGQELLEIERKGS